VVLRPLLQDNRDKLASHSLMISLSQSHLSVCPAWTSN